jgi:hypothetical protein
MATSIGIGVLGGVVLIDPVTRLPYRARDAQNFAGSVRVDYTGVSLIGFVAEVARELPIGSGTAVVDSTFTTWPSNVAVADRVYEPTFFNSTTTRLRENFIDSQQHTWRLDFNYSSKTVAAAGSIDLELYNPDTGFVNIFPYTTGYGRATSAACFELSTVSNIESHALAKGYRLRVRTSFTDPNLIVGLTRIVRFSHATEVVYA